MKKTLVTAIYYSSPYSRIGGRAYHFEHYEAPFRNILNLDCNIVIYSHESEINKIEKFMERHNFSNYKIINYDLNSYVNSNIIYDLKEKSGLIDANGLINDKNYISNDRNHHLCLSKINLLNDAIRNEYFLSEKYFWIDAGLFHHGIFPESYGGVEKFIKVLEKNYWPNKESNVCNPGLIDRLLNKTNSGFIFMGLNQHSRARYWDTFCENDYITHIVGGLFGGDAETLKNIETDFVELSTKILNSGILVLEEEILSMLFSMKYNNLGYLRFENWYHDIPTDKNYFGVGPDTASFYKLFL